MNHLVTLTLLAMVAGTCTVDGFIVNLVGDTISGVKNITKEVRSKVGEGFQDLGELTDEVFSTVGTIVKGSKNEVEDNKDGQESTETGQDTATAAAAGVSNSASTEVKTTKDGTVTAETSNEAAAAAAASASASSSA